ncbi:hypothetical protein QBC47DRAFT_101860 [Echria macrotheca]|uniref:Transmembrane protein n=1 Tax=Echria macrotheca TaxID=438768 RepID=A0AAJ0BJW3_9PEZI|nr:hypothetical protein QBC47DRAFT_101860 [Echria macrotheca]
MTRPSQRGEPRTAGPSQTSRQSSLGASNALDDHDAGQTPEGPSANTSRHGYQAAAPQQRAKKLASSVTGFFSKLHPRNRPERGFTARRCDACSWERERENSATPSGPRRSTSAPDTIPSAQWRTPMSLPQSPHSAKVRPSNRSVSASTRVSSVRSQRAGSAPDSDGVDLPTVKTIVPPVRELAVRTAPLGTSSSLSTMSQTVVPEARPPAADQTEELFMAKQEARRQRRTLKESGDFLGVTGVNPHTGEMDVLTPTTSSDEACPPSMTSSPRSARVAQRSQQAGEEDRHSQSEARRRRLGEPQENARRHKDAVPFVQPPVKLRFEDKQWSSVALPQLSPIVQSQASSTSTTSIAPTVLYSPMSGSFLGNTAATVCRRQEFKPLEKKPAPEVHCPGNIVLKFGGSLSAVTANISSTPGRRTGMRVMFTPPIPQQLLLPQACQEEGDQAEVSHFEDRIQSGPDSRSMTTSWAEALVQGLGSLVLGSKTQTSRSMELWKVPQLQEKAAAETAAILNGTTRPSTYTPITTTTGSEWSHREQAGQVYGERAGASEETLLPITAVSRLISRLLMSTEAVIARSLASHPSLTEMTKSAYSKEQASPRPEQRSSWPRAISPRPSPALGITVGGHVVATVNPISEVPLLGPPSDTISVPQEQATSDCGERYPSMSPVDQQQTHLAPREMPKTMRRGPTDVMQLPTALSRTCMSTYRDNQPCNQRGGFRVARKPLPGGAELNTAMARTAARTAFVQRLPETAERRLRGAEHRPTLEAVEESSSCTEDGGGTESPSGEMQALLDSSKAGPAADVVMVVRSALIFSAGGVSAVWKLVKPVFDADSALRLRYEQGISTWEDCAVYVLALVFVLGAILVGVWVFRGFVWLLRGVAGIGRGCLFLAGL